MINPLVPPTTAARKRLLQTPTKMKILLTAIAVTAVSALGAPYGPNIPLPTYVAGDYTSNNNKYHWEYDSYFGGHWTIVTGNVKNNRDGTYTETFHGTISNTALAGTFTKTSSLQWLSDSYFLGNKMVGYHHSWLACESVELVIGGGNVHGTATYRP